MSKLEDYLFKNHRNMLEKKDADIENFDRQLQKILRRSIFDHNKGETDEDRLNYALKKRMQLELELFETQYMKMRYQSYIQNRF